MKRSLFTDDIVDIIVSDHMSGGKDLIERIKVSGIFNNCYYVESLEYARRKMILNKRQRKIIRMFPNIFLRRFLKLGLRYDDIYISNLDVFSRLVYHSVYRKNKKCKLFIFEDGLSTYTKIFENYYWSCYNFLRSRKEVLLSRYFYRDRPIFNNVEGMYLFNPQYMMWKPNFDIIKIEKIDRNDIEFVKMCNKVFDCNNIKDSYKEPFIFMEESFNLEGNQINDLEIIEDLSLRVGKENIFVKRHPREKSNRFGEKGFKTNKDFYIPWEVILLNLECDSEKRIISVCSGSMFNPIILFDMNIKSYSIFNLVDKNCKSSFSFTEDFWEVFNRIAEENPDRIIICDSLDDIV